MCIINGYHATRVSGQKRLSILDLRRFGSMGCRLPALMTKVEPGGDDLSGRTGDNDACAVSLIRWYISFATPRRRSVSPDDQTPVLPYRPMNAVRNSSSQLCSLFQQPQPPCD